ncbi:MAG: TolC family protein [Proteobacteria bacterium]|nr:TolC family protein [Pseudomonadota bacterium]
MIIFLSGCSPLQSAEQRAEKTIEKKEWLEHQKWWGVFDDPLLNKLADQLLNQNIDIQIAEARLCEANALKVMARADFFPNISGTASATRGNLSSPKLMNYTQTGLDTSWEIDIFGKRKASVDSAESNQLRRAAGVDDARNIVIADLTKAVIEWRQATYTLNEIKGLVIVQNNQIDLLSTRVKAGLIEASFLERALGLRAETKAALPQIQASANAAHYQIEKLINCRDDSVRKLLNDNRSLRIKLPEPQHLKTISFKSLAKRPDIKMAKAALLETHADFRQAEANLWPQVSLSTFFGVQHPSNTFFLASNLVWSIGSSLSFPLLNFGKLRGAVAAADARVQQALLNYENTVNFALQETRTALSDYLNALNALKEQAQALKNRQNTVSIAKIRFEKGLTDMTDLTTVQTEVKQSTLNLISLTTDAAIAYVRFQKALGLSVIAYYRLSEKDFMELS